MHRWLFAFAFGLFCVGLAYDGLNDWVEQTHLPPLIHETSAEILDRDGRLLRAYPVEGGRWRLATRPSDVDTRFLDMLIQIEDKRFYEHRGVDPRAAARALGQAVWNGRVVSGGSTLTMQTARLIENSGTGGWSGKLRQIRVALALERRLTKSDILTLYLTHAPYGGNVEGVRAASYAWFSKPPMRLSNAEAALLVALPQAPNARRPDRHPKSALRARDRILTRLGKSVAHTSVPNAMNSFPRIAPHLADRARRKAPDQAIVQLSIDSEIQRKLERLAAHAVQDMPRQVSSAILVADHSSGEVLGYVGAARYGASDHAGYLDMVQAVRSPGSTLKPLIYALAFDQGLVHPETLISDTPVAFGSYAPQNFDGQFRGDVTIRRALELSLNIPPVLLTEAMGPHRLMSGLKRAGATPQVPTGKAGLAVALGGVGITLQDLVQLYAGLANKGRAPKLRWRLDQTVGETQDFVSDASAWQVEHILSGIQPPRGQSIGDVAFKTGTSYGHRDTWAIGWDGRHVIGVWLGRPDGTPVPGIFGGDVAAPILFEAFGRIKTQFDPLRPPPPETLLQDNALLPKPLQRFASRSTFKRDVDALDFAFPPDGARLRLTGDDQLVVKLKGGTPPFAILTNGKPVLTGIMRRDVDLPNLDYGYSSLQVVDSDGKSDQINIRRDH